MNHDQLRDRLAVYINPPSHTLCCGDRRACIRFLDSVGRTLPGETDVASSRRLETDVASSRRQRGTIHVQAVHGDELVIGERVGRGDGRACVSTLDGHCEMHIRRERQRSIYLDSVCVKDTA